MRVIIWKKKKGGKAVEWAKMKRLKDAKETLHRQYTSAREFFDDQMTEEDGLYEKGSRLCLFGDEYWIEQDTTVGYKY